MIIKKINLKINFNKKSKLIKGFQRSNGRNNQGKITVRYKGGGHKRLYRKITFKRTQIHQGIVKKILYDPNRSSHIAFIENENFSFFIIAPENLTLNQKIQTGPESSLKIGNSLPLEHIPIGSKIHNISLHSNSKGILVRSAGTYAELIQKYNNKLAKIKFNSGKIKFISLSCYATLGIVSNINHNKKKLTKAGQSRWLNKRPKVRGVAKNPVDHPHGGGEGKTSGGRPSVSPKGLITKGRKTKKKSNK